MADDDTGGGNSTADAMAPGAGDDDNPGQLVLGIVIGLVAGAPPPPSPNLHLVGGVICVIFRCTMIGQGVCPCLSVCAVRLEKGRVGVR